MKQSNNFSGVRIKPGHVRSFEAIAMNASQGQVLQVGFTAVLSYKDVIDLEWRRVQRRGQLTVSATPFGALPNSADQISVQYVCLLSGVLQRAAPWDCMTGSRLLTWR